MEREEINPPIIDHPKICHVSRSCMTSIILLSLFSTSILYLLYILLIVLKHANMHSLTSLLSRSRPSLLSKRRPPIRSLSTLPNLPLFQAIKNHNESNPAVIHSASTRSFTYGNLVADILQQKEKLAQTAGDGVRGERIAFLAENSYDYVGVYHILDCVGID